MENYKNNSIICREINLIKTYINSTHMYTHTDNNKKYN